MDTSIGKLMLINIIVNNIILSYTKKNINDEK